MPPSGDALLLRPLLPSTHERITTGGKHSNGCCPHARPCTARIPQICAAGAISAAGHSTLRRSGPALAGAEVSAPGWPAQYEIRVAGVLDGRWAGWFDGLQISGQGEETVICGLVADQPALHGLLTKVRDLGLCLISVRRLATRRRHGLLTPAEGGSPRVTWGDEGTAGSLYLPETAGVLSWFSAHAGNPHAAAALTADGARTATTSDGQRGGGRGPGAWPGMCGRGHRGWRESTLLSRQPRQDHERRQLPEPLCCPQVTLWMPRQRRVLHRHWPSYGCRRSLPGPSC
jgi:hypothetical protein